MPQHEPASQEEYEARVDTAYTLLMRGMSKRDARRYISEKIEWGKSISRRMIYYYLEDAEKQIAQMATEGVDRRAEFAKAVTRLNWQYMKADQLNDTARAIQAQNALNTLLRLDEPQAAMDWEQSITVEDPNRIRSAAMMLITVARHSPAVFNQLYDVIQAAAHEAQQVQVIHELPESGD